MNFHLIKVFVWLKDTEGCTSIRKLEHDDPCYHQTLI